MKKWILLVLVVSFSFLKGWAESDTLLLRKNSLEDFDTLGWQFFVGDNPEYARRDWPGQGIEVFDTEFTPKDSLYKHLQPVGWYRRWIRASPDMKGKILGMTFIGYGFLQVYLDGELLTRNGKKSGQTGSFYDHPVFFALTDTHAHLLAVRYENQELDATDTDGEWGFRSSLMEAESVYHTAIDSQKTITLIVLPIGSTFATLFMVHILLFFFYRKDISNLYFALFNLGCTVFFFTVYLLSVWHVDIGNTLLSSGLITLSSVLSCYAIAAFCTHLFSRRKVFLRIIAAISILVSVAAFLVYDSLEYQTYVEQALAALAILTSVYVVVLFVQALIKRVPGSGILGLGILFTIFFIFGLIATYIFNNGNLSTDNLVLGFVLIVLSILAIFSIPLSISSFLAWRYASTSKNLQKQLDTVAALSERTLQQEKEKQHILENQKAELEKEVAVRTEEIVLEKQKSDNLLLNILPQEVADELKQKGESRARYHDEVSVLFTDFVNFTTLSEKLGVEELLNELNLNFTAFDNIMEKYGLEKIKTIGDAYLAVSGLPQPDPAHARHAVQAALEILDFVKQRQQQVSYGLDIRIGIHSGSLVAGIIGVKKFAYDIWGDTVNTAARMEQNSLPGKINLSEQTYRLVQNDFACTYRGKISVKGKGDLDMYFVEV